MLPGSEREKANIDRKKKKEEEAVGGSEKKQKKGSSEERRHSTHLFHLYLPPSSLKTKTQDCKSPDVKLTNDADSKHGHLSFRGKGEGADPEAHEYGLDLNLFAAIDVEGSKVATSDRGVVLVVAKADKDAEEHWPRLLKASGKAPSNIVSVFFLGGGGGGDEGEERERERVFSFTLLSSAFFHRPLTLFPSSPFFPTGNKTSKKKKKKKRKSTGTAGRMRTTRPRPRRRALAAPAATTAGLEGWTSPL